MLLYLRLFLTLEKDRTIHLFFFPGHDNVPNICHSISLSLFSHSIHLLGQPPSLLFFSRIPCVLGFMPHILPLLLSLVFPFPHFTFHLPPAPFVFCFSLPPHTPTSFCLPTMPFARTFYVCIFTFFFAHFYFLPFLAHLPRLHTPHTIFSVLETLTEGLDLEGDRAPRRCHTHPTHTPPPPHGPPPPAFHPRPTYAPTPTTCPLAPAHASPRAPPAPTHPLPPDKNFCLHAVWVCFFRAWVGHRLLMETFVVLLVGWADRCGEPTTIPWKTLAPLVNMCCHALQKHRTTCVLPIYQIAAACLAPYLLPV